jgi:hypothetical protein
MSGEKCALERVWMEMAIWQADDLRRVLELEGGLITYQSQPYKWVSIDKKTSEMRTTTVLINSKIGTDGKLLVAMRELPSNGYRDKKTVFSRDEIESKTPLTIHDLGYFGTYAVAKTEGMDDIYKMEGGILYKTKGGVIVRRI